MRETLGRSLELICITYRYQLACLSQQHHHFSYNFANLLLTAEHYAHSGANLEAIYFSEGRCTPASGTAFFYEYTIKDHLGNARVSFRAITNGTAIQPLQENHYYPFGMEMEGTWLAQVGTENQYEYNGKELNEDFGLGLYDYGARWYDAALGRWWSVDPLSTQYNQWSTYNYGIDNPIRFLDPDGRSVTTDYYDQKGKRLGTDGNENGKIVVVTNKKEVKVISKADKAGGKTAENDVKSGVALPSAFIRAGMGRAVERAGSPSNHEEGGLYGTDYDGNEVVVDAKPGSPVRATNEDVAINEFDLAEGQPDIKVVEGTFHTHPDMVTQTGSDDANSIGTRTQTPFEQEPSKADYRNAEARAARGSVKGNSIVLAQGNNTAYIYNKDGLQATFPLSSFITIGINKKD